MQHVNHRRNCAGEGEGTWEPFELSQQFFCKPTTALKNKVLMYYLTYM